MWCVYIYIYMCVCMQHIVLIYRKTLYALLRARISSFLQLWQKGQSSPRLAQTITQTCYYYYCYYSCYHTYIIIIMVGCYHYYSLLLRLHLLYHDTFNLTDDLWTSYLHWTPGFPGQRWMHVPTLLKLGRCVSSHCSRLGSVCIFITIILLLLYR